VTARSRVVMVCDPDQRSEARRYCGEGAEVLPHPDRRFVDARQRPDLRSRPLRSGGPRPIPVNSWGERYLPYDRGRIEDSLDCSWGSPRTRIGSSRRPLTSAPYAGNDSAVLEHVHYRILN
jgi:hypothetical protein